MKFSSFEQNGWKWCDQKLVTGRSHKVKVTKKYIYLSDDKLDDDEESIT